MHDNDSSQRCRGPRFEFTGIFSPRLRILRILCFTMGGIVFAGLFALLFGWLVQLLWNWLMPDLFSLKSISYWQAFGIVVLAKLLLGGCGSRHGGHRFGRHFQHVRHYHKHGDHGDDYNGDDTWKPHGSYRNWKYYDQYWRDEGKAAFEAYIDKLNKEGKVG